MREFTTKPGSQPDRRVLRLETKDKANLEAFYDEFLEATSPHPFDSRASIYDDSIVVKLSFWTSKNSIYISHIQSLEPRTGAANRLMAFLTGLADKHGVALDLLAKSTNKKRISTKRLIAFYKKWGFQPEGYPDADGAVSMQRPPLPKVIKLRGFRRVNPTRESKKIKISSRGPVSVAFADGFSADLWYDHTLARTWVLQLKDSEGDQVGPAWDGSAEYNHRRQDAVSSLLDLAEEHGGIVEVLASPEDEPRRNPRMGMRSASLYYGRGDGSQTKEKRAPKARLAVMEEFYLEDAVKYWASADAQSLSKKLRDARIPLEETGLVWDLSRGDFSEFDLSSIPVALAQSIVALYMKSPLTTREIEKLKKANYFLTEMLMDPEDAIAPVPEALQYEKEAIGPAKPALARELLHFYESTAPGDF